MIIGDDMLMNIVTDQFANNFSNIKLPGYLYILRNVSVSHGRSDELKQNISFAIFKNSLNI